jgi:hypothetical protein
MPISTLPAGLVLGFLLGSAEVAASVWGPPPGTGTSRETAGDEENFPQRGAGWEISPTLGIMGGSALLGLRASMLYRPVTLEAVVEQVMGRAATLYPITVNAILDLAAPARAVPFAIIGGGLFLTVPSNSVGDEPVSAMGANFGGGLRYDLNRQLGIRFETKQLFTPVQNRLDTQARDELLIFQSTSLGVIFAFD